MESNDTAECHLHNCDTVFQISFLTGGFFFFSEAWLAIFRLIFHFLYLLWGIPYTWKGRTRCSGKDTAAETALSAAYIDGDKGYLKVCCSKVRGKLCVVQEVPSLEAAPAEV